MAVTLEQVLDKLADHLISQPYVDTPTVRANQKTIRNGLIDIARSNSEKLILFETDSRANKEDLLTLQSDNPPQTQTLVQIIDVINTEFTPTIDNITFYSTWIEGDTDAIPPTYPTLDYLELQCQSSFYEMTDIIRSTESSNPINLSQFMNLEELTQNIDVGLAEEYLDTTIFELLPGAQTRRERITNFFNEFNFLIGDKPDFQLTAEGLIGDDFDPLEYSEFHDITMAYTTPDYGLPAEESFITRLDETAAAEDESQYRTHTLQNIRNRLNDYLKDVDEVLPPQVDERPEYRNESSGYLKFRNLNQGIIIRNTESPFLDNLNPDTQQYLNTGFTITMWVRFLDKSSQGTLFNFGNPYRENNPMGFRLETYVIKRDDYPLKQGWTSNSSHTWGDIFQDGGVGNDNYDFEPPTEGFFSEDNAERFVRLVVRDGTKIRASHVGMPFMNRREGIPDFGQQDYYTDWTDASPTEQLPYDHEFGLMTNTRVPIDYGEWYFICASYNPFIQEDISHSDENIYATYKNDPDFWRGNKNPDGGSYTHHSTYGTRCKVEIISRSDLLRARGFNV